MFDHINMLIAVDMLYCGDSTQWSPLWLLFVCTTYIPYVSFFLCVRVHFLFPSISDHDFNVHLISSLEPFFSFVGLFFNNFSCCWHSFYLVWHYWTLSRFLLWWVLWMYEWMNFLPAIKQKQFWSSPSSSQWHGNLANTNSRSLCPVRPTSSALTTVRPHTLPSGSWLSVCVYVCSTSLRIEVHAMALLHRETFKHNMSETRLTYSLTSTIVSHWSIAPDSFCMHVHLCVWMCFTQETHTHLYILNIRYLHKCLLMWC